MRATILLPVSVMAFTLPSDAAAVMQEELASLPEEDCMSIPQLRDAVRAAAWSTQSSSQQDRHRHTAVILTSCNLDVRA